MGDNLYLVETSAWDRIAGELASLSPVTPETLADLFARHGRSFETFWRPEGFRNTFAESWDPTDAEGVAETLRSALAALVGPVSLPGGTEESHYFEAGLEVVVAEAQERISGLGALDLFRERRFAVVPPERLRVTDDFTQTGILGCWSAAQLGPCAECLELLASQEQVAAALGLDARHPDAIQDRYLRWWLTPDSEAWEDWRMLVGLTRRAVANGGLLAFA